MKAKYEPMLNLKFRRIEKGMTQEDLAKKIDISPNLISMYELGKIYPRKPTLDAMAKALECEIKDIV